MSDIEEIDDVDPPISEEGQVKVDALLSAADKTHVPYILIQERMAMLFKEAAEYGASYTEVANCDGEECDQYHCSLFHQIAAIALDIEEGNVT